MSELKSLLEKPEFPRSMKYDQDWMMDNQMGPNAIWLVEWLAEALELKPGMRVLDLGCGKGMTSIFLAKEFGVRVYGADLWMNPDNTWKRVVEAGVPDLICPVKAEAHALPFAAGFFDAAISIDAYQYFGTDELYLDYLTRFVRPGGQIGVVVVGLMQPFGGTIPAHLTAPQENGQVFWENGCRSFKTSEFWKDLWERNAAVERVSIEAQADGWRHWRDFERALEITGKSIFPSYAETLDNDAGRFLGFHRLVARRSSFEDENYYSPSLGVRAGVDR